jgi:hypothetical protein
MKKYKLLFKDKAVALKKFGKYTCWFYEKQFVITKRTYKKENKDNQRKENIICFINDEDIIDIMNRESITSRRIRMIEKQRILY